MIKRFLSLPIRTHLIVLACLLVLPSIILIVHSGILEREQAIKDTEEDCIRFVNAIATEQHSVMVGTEQLTMALSLLPPIQSRNTVAANAILSDISRKNPLYSIISVADMDGLIWASSLPFTETVSIADRKYFQDVLRTGMFSSGEYVIGKISKKHIITFGYPIKNSAGVLSGVIIIGLVFDYVLDAFKTAKLPANSSFGIIDHRGIIVYRNFQDDLSKQFQGSRNVKEEIFATMKRGPDEGAFTAVGIDDNVRIFAYKKLRLPHEQAPYLYVLASVTQAEATTAATAKMYKYLVILGLIFVFGIAVSWLIGKLIIVDRIMLLKTAARKLSESDERFKVASIVQGGELGELADSFDNMAIALSEREMALLDSESRFRNISAVITDFAFACEKKPGEPYQIKWMTGAVEEITGYTTEEIMSMGCWRPLVLESHLPIFDELVGEMAPGGTGRFEIAVNHREKGLRWLLVCTRALEDVHDPSIHRLYGACQDITDRTHAEEEVRSSEQRLSQIVEFLPDATLVIDRAGKVLAWNHAIEVMTGIKSKDMIGKGDFEYAVPFYGVRRPILIDLALLPRPELEDKYTGIYWIGNIMVGEAFAPSLPRGETHLSATASVLRDGKGEVVAAIECIRDNTDRKRAEEELRQTLARLRRVTGSVIDVIVMAVETRDPYTAGHQKGVADLARSIASELGLPIEQVEGIRMAATIHDLGKISIPAEILSMPRKLNNIEWQLAKNHVQAGYDILKEVDFGWPVADIVLQHHERLDGSGYPQGLKGDDILLEARIIAVADVVDAMATHRPYRPALGIEAALGEIKKNRGILYDPNVVDACLKLCGEKGSRFY